MIEKINFREKMEKINGEAADACMALFKEYGITELELMEPCSADREGDVQNVWAVKLDDTESEHKYNWIMLRGDYEEWFSAGDGYSTFDWIGLYDCMVDTINHFLENDIPVSEWNSRESFDE